MGGGKLTSCVLLHAHGSLHPHTDLGMTETPCGTKCFPVVTHSDGGVNFRLGSQSVARDPARER